MRHSAFRSLSVAALLALAAELGPVTRAPAADAVLATYTATYQVEYKGRNAGLAEFSVSYDAAQDVYTFRSSLKVKGLLRLIAPNAAVEHSVFIVRDGRIEPHEFRYEDGSRKGGDNYQARFDWDAKKVVLEGEQRVELDLAPGMLDRGTLQVALMRDMAARATLGPYVLADQNSLKTFEYTLLGEERMQTPLGELRVVRYRQQRVGSSASASLWAAPQLKYLPVRIERQRGDETDTIFVLESVEGLGLTQ